MKLARLPRSGERDRGDNVEDKVCDKVMTSKRQKRHLLRFDSDPPRHADGRTSTVSRVRI